MHTSRLLIAVLIAALAIQASAQTPADDPRRVKPTAAMARLNHFVGNYVTVMERKGKSLQGTMEIKPVVGGWYLERTNYTRSENGEIDSEIRSLITWDPERGHYRIWRFVQLTPQDRHDGVGRFEGEEFIEEYPIERSSGPGRLLRNRITMTSRNEMRIVSEVEHADGKVAQRGVIIATRVK